MTYLKGKDLRHKGHTLECYLNMCPDYIVYKTKRVESITALSFETGVNITTDPEKKPEGFEGW